MRDRDKLIELLKNQNCDSPMFCDAKCKYSQLESCYEARTADHLIENDVICPPCKVGDTVWKIEDVWHLDDRETWTYHYEKEVLEFMARSISISCNSKGIKKKPKQN